MNTGLFCHCVNPVAFADTIVWMILDFAFSRRAMAAMNFLMYCAEIISDFFSNIACWILHESISFDSSALNAFACFSHDVFSALTFSCSQPHYTS